MKDKSIQIRATEEQKEQAKDASRKYGFDTIAGFFWFCVKKANRKK